MTFVRTINPGFTRGIPGSEHGDAEYAITRTGWTAWSLFAGERHSPEDGGMEEFPFKIMNG